MARSSSYTPVLRTSLQASPVSPTACPPLAGGVAGDDGVLIALLDGF
jgi:hypothetical protein